MQIGTQKSILNTATVCVLKIRIFFLLILQIDLTNQNDIF
jgi:hypothetical protein